MARIDRIDFSGIADEPKIVDNSCAAAALRSADYRNRGRLEKRLEVGFPMRSVLFHGSYDAPLLTFSSMSASKRRQESLADNRIEELADLRVILRHVESDRTNMRIIYQLGIFIFDAGSHHGSAKTCPQLLSFRRHGKIDVKLCGIGMGRLLGDAQIRRADHDRKGQNRFDRRALGFHIHDFIAEDVHRDG